MKRLLAAGLLLAAGCDRMVSRGPAPVYASWEAGQTLVYARPGAEAGQRLQVRVKSSRPGPDGLTVVRTYSSFTGVSEATFRLRDGLEALELEGSTEMPVTPEGFPDRVSRWEERGFVNFVVGRARVAIPGVKLPDPDAVGIWVESVPVAFRGVRRRTLLVPDLGEVETLNLVDGKWVTVNRLVSQGFTDPPPEGVK
ncbi:hypothetical protein [Mesoterricola silvestris]|uniref:Lipoprotein n=1 Tax=Mesoterricola silvestris TaxID=2927979 RepID=A0AA48K9N0_9BACT|nr:hypothetical protein [Mesoterricola silvestris]BDU73671.1 hypothetical protein METEAL_28450 [Mesoterricola silvestris]